jgi:glycosyltransferase involved in cell wall biosynthesis
MLKDWPPKRMTVCGPPPPEVAQTLDCNYVAWKPFASRMQVSRFHTLAPPLSWIQPVRPPVEKQPGPGVVVTIMQASVYYRGAAWFARRHSLPLVLIVHDDPEKLEGVRPWNRPLVHAGNRRVYRFASERFCISPEMEKSLRERYGAPGSVLYPNRSPDIRSRSESMNSALRRGNRLTIGYAGSLVYGYREGIENLLPLFRDVGATLRVYSIHEPKFAHGAELEYAGASATPEAVWPQIQAECDAVILPYCGPEDGHVELYRTHFPSKLTEYLALGMPVIVSGPEYATGVRWAARNPKACVCMELANPAEWRAMLVRLCNDSDWRLALASGALSAAGGDFDPETIRRKFQDRLMKLQGGS